MAALPTSSPRFLAQPAQGSGGHYLVGELTAKRWTSLEVAVAWVRQSGVKQIQAAMEFFLAQGGTAVFVCGVDFENTSEEGLSLLLALGTKGNITVYVHHNESQSTVFHPKVYLCGVLQQLIGRAT